MRRPMVAGNWKMNGNRSDAEALVGSLLKGAGSVKQAEVVLCPPFILIPMVAALLKGGKIAWGGQNLNTHASGAHTGEISGPMLRDYGCSYVIVGHSERRALYGENDQLVAQKFKSAQDAGLTPIFCVGETLDERESGKTEAVVARQLGALLTLTGIGGLHNSVLAYEPVWAIGTGKTASPQQAQEVHSFIRARLAEADKKIAAGLRILYGGSVKGSNAAELFAQADIDGGLIGGASLNAEDFLTICRAGG